MSPIVNILVYHKVTQLIEEYPSYTPLGVDKSINLIRKLFPKEVTHFLQMSTHKMLVR